ncbi:aminotransferase class I/II-fold pyridoxal phosphate-dependent enzyme [Candidatus Sumerlaeota bacterium]|nr:aminotransferase class I/II-fold pyridoxal phosphate-dependent enzyme [Candidatus Sumerlaeota bacterium]
MNRTSVVREEIQHLKTLGLLGEIFQISMKMKKEGISFLPLHLGDPGQFDFPPLSSFKEGIARALEKPASFAYGNPQGFPPLIEKIAEMENVDPRYVFTGNGVSDMMDKLLNATAIQGTNILFPAPVFPPYLDLNTKNGVESRLYLCDPHTWQPILSSLESRIDDNTSMILVNSPNNPTGAVYDRENITAIIELTENINLSRKKRNIPPLCLIFDEIYKELYFENKPAEVKSLLDDRFLSWIIFNGASKSFCSTGLRIGYAILGGVERDSLREVLYNECILPLCMNSIFQEGYLAALCDPARDEYFENNRKKLQSRRDLLLHGFSRISGIEVVKPMGAFYMIVKMETEFKNDLELGKALLTEEKLCASQLSAFFDSETHPPGVFLRLVILPPEDILEQALDRFTRFMERRAL